MTYFGPVAEAAHGGQSSPGFDLLVGFGLLALTWIGYGHQSESKKVTLSAALGVSAICAVFIISGFIALLK